MLSDDYNSISSDDESDYSSYDDDWKSMEETERYVVDKSTVGRTVKMCFLTGDELQTVLTELGQFIVPYKELSLHEQFKQNEQKSNEKKRREKNKKRKDFLEELAKENANKKETEEEEPDEKPFDISNEACMSTVLNGKCSFPNICQYNHSSKCIAKKKSELKKIYGVVIKNPQYTLSDTKLRDLLKQFGKINRVKIAGSNAYVTFDNSSSAFKSVAELRKSRNQSIEFNFNDTTNNQSFKGGKGNQSTKGGKGNQSFKGKGNQSFKGGKGNQSFKGGKGNQSTKGKGNQSTKGGKGNNRTPSICRNFSTTGKCPYGDKCHFLHK